MKKILIFKSDKIGDLINISSVIKNIKLNFKDSEITIVCSDYNSNIAKFYPEITNILIFNNSIIKFFFNYFKFLITTKFDYIFQFDGKKKSYILGSLIRSDLRSCILYIKKKTYLDINFISKRPNFINSFFYNHKIKCNEDLIATTNDNYHYLSLYLETLKKSNIKIFTTDHYLPYNGLSNNDFYDYIHLHVDERWVEFVDPSFFGKFVNFLEYNSQKHRFYITSNLEGNFFFNKLRNYFCDNESIKFNKNADMKELIDIIYNCHTSISNHTGFTVHVAASFKKKIVDIVSPELNLHYDRWVPKNINYSRYDFSNFFSSFSF